VVTKELDPLSMTFAALADPTRRAIIARLADGPATVKEISAPFPMSGPAVSKHLRVLERAGLIARGREAQWRPCTLAADPIRSVADWAETYRQFWEASGDRLEQYLAHLQAVGASPSGAGSSTTSPTTTSTTTSSREKDDRATD
jgi:DNA-binding transcriptional ArsR family regulator